ncbi:MAG: hypothetical protein IEMM0008_0783 [bacterium]|nr:MAG: hypothetical protein IEMM0008_0783 [bacterium]
MGKEKREVSTKLIMDVSEVITYLQDLASGLKAGQVCVQQGNEFVTLKPVDLIKVEIEAVQKKDKEKFTLEISWKNEAKEVGEINTLKISSKEPVVKKTVPESTEKVAKANK